MNTKRAEDSAVTKLELVATQIAGRGRGVIERAGEQPNHEDKSLRIRT
jgi:hypothetical protein